MIGLFGPGNGQTGGFWLILLHMSIYPLSLRLLSNSRFDALGAPVLKLSQMSLPLRQQAANC
jgi:hypothetical protein